MTQLLLSTQTVRLSLCYLGDGDKCRLVTASIDERFDEILLQGNDEYNGF